MLNLKQHKPLIATGAQLNETEHLFTRILDDVIEAQIKKLEMTDDPSIVNIQQPLVESETAVAVVESEIANSTSEIVYAPLGETITYDDFAKMDIRTGTVLTAEAMKKSDKLLKLSIDLGFETRTILSGIAKHFSPEEMVGKKVVVLANLAPRKMMGILSNGMVLMAENAEGKLALVAPPDEWQDGSIVK